MTSVPSNIAYEESGLVLLLSLYSSFSGLSIFVLLHPGVLLALTLIILFIPQFVLEVGCLLALLGLLHFARNDSSLVEVSVVDGVLHLELIGGFGDGKFHCDVTAFEIFATAFLNNFGSLLSRFELNEPESSVLVVLGVQRHVDGVDGYILNLAEESLELLVPDVEGQITDNELALMLARGLFSRSRFSFFSGGSFFWSVEIGRAHV